MGKKRACRRLVEENAMHERAVKLRKMTDKQLCEYLDSSIAQSEEKGYKRGLKESEETNKSENCSVEEYLSMLQSSKIPGIGIVTINKLLKVARENGYI